MTALEAKAMYRKAGETASGAPRSNEASAVRLLQRTVPQRLPDRAGYSAYLQAMVDGDAEESTRDHLRAQPASVHHRYHLPASLRRQVHCSNYYEETLHIRETKLAAASQAYNEILPALKAEGSR